MNKLKNKFSSIGLPIKTMSIIGLMLLHGCASLSSHQKTIEPTLTAAKIARAAAASIEDKVEENVVATEALDPGINRIGNLLRVSPLEATVPEVVNPTQTVELNYEQEDLRLVIEQLGTALGINMIIDPAIDNKVSLRTQPSNPLRYDDIWPLLRLLTRNAGVSVQNAGSFWEFKKIASELPSELTMPAYLDESAGGIQLQVTPLKYISLSNAQSLLNPILGDATFVSLGTANILGIQGTADQLQRINSLLQVMDTDPFQNRGIKLYALTNSPAEEVAKELENLLKLIEGEQPAYLVLGLARINSVLVMAPAERGFQEIDRWLQVLDAASQEQVEQLFVYRVKNLQASSLATTLSQVYGNNNQNTETDLPRVSFLTPQALPADAASQSINTQNQSEMSSANIKVNIVADEESNALLVRATPRDYRQLLSTLSSLDRVTPQVLIHAVIGQVTLNEGSRFGIDWTRVSGSLATGPARLSSRFLPTTLVDNTGRALTNSGLVLTRSMMDGSAVIDATLNAIAEDNDVSLLARPTILATNNKEGSIHVGQSVPVNNGTTVVGNGVTTENIAYQNVGIDLKITPQISDDGYINLEIEQALSSVEDGATGVAGNPTFTDQKITTSVVVSDLSTITLGGLIQQEESDQQSGVPLLMQVPGLGRLFSYNNVSTKRRELFVILRPQIIRTTPEASATYEEYRASFIELSEVMNEAGL